MKFRGRLIAAALAVAIIPLTLLALGVRRQLAARLLAQHRASVAAQARVAREDLERESAAVAARLAALARLLEGDDRFRLAVRGAAAERAYLLDYAAAAMRSSGLAMLQIQDEEGRILSSGHFRNEFDRLEADLPRLVGTAPAGAVVLARAPEGPFLALVRTDSARIAERRLDLVGGIAIDSVLLRRLARHQDATATLVTPDAAGGESDDQAAAIDDIALPYVDAARRAVDSARLVIRQPATGLRELQRDVDRWFAASLLVVVALAVALAIWSAARLSAPIARLVDATERIALDRAGVSAVAAAGGRHDEIGMLARTLDSMTRRLRSSAAKLRDAERRATMGEMARQVNHDIKNGLLPIRNVLRHLGEVAERRPGDLPSIFVERRGTMESSVAYLETLARRYASLAPPAEPRVIDLDALVRDTVAAAGADGATVEAQIDEGAPRVNADPILLRRILENLIRNGIESMNGQPGRILVRASRAPEGSARIAVSDTGRGMTDEELARAFDDFFTTKPGGTGLGLSVVRRLTADLGGSLRVATEPGRGTTITIELPAGPPRPAH